jgi:FlaA1/EpsC-like NDP-sugar epimerase
MRGLPRSAHYTADKKRVSFRRGLAYLLRMAKILITGGAGSVGRFLTERFYRTHEIQLFDKDDYLLWEMSRKYRGVQLTLGDVRETVDLRNSVKWADVIIHAAAYKNIEITELNPLATCDNDFYGTVSVVHEVQKHSGKKFILISTDKAVYPLSALGASKMLAERFVIEANWATDAQLAIARFVNVEETRGNVFELWRQQIAAGQVPEITDLRMERHFNSIEKVQDLFEHILSDMRGGEVFIPDVPKLRVIDRFQQLYGPSHPYRVVGIRRNEKLYDPLYTDEEAPFVERRSGYLVIDYNRIREAYAARGNSTSEAETAKALHSGQRIAN